MFDMSGILLFFIGIFLRFLAFKEGDENIFNYAR